MPFGTCPRCERFFALDSERSLQSHCPRCDQPLRLLPREEAVAALRRLEARHPVALAAPDRSTPPAGVPPAAEPHARSSIPPAEMAILGRTIVEVVGLAVHEQRDQGCTYLIHALCYAEQSRLAGEPWGEALVRRYHDLLDTFTLRYVVRAR